MVKPLILMHAILAEIGLFAFLCVLVELLNPIETRIRRAKVAAVIGAVCLLIVASLHKFDKEIIKNKDARVSIILLAGLVFLLGFSIAGMGAIISSGYRFALESGLA